MPRRGGGAITSRVVDRPPPDPILIRENKGILAVIRVAMQHVGIYNARA
jgi:hypothetical protein